MYNNIVGRTYTLGQFPCKPNKSQSFTHQNSKTFLQAFWIHRGPKWRNAQLTLGAQDPPRLSRICSCVWPCSFWSSSASWFSSWPCPATASVTPGTVVSSKCETTPAPPNLRTSISKRSLRETRAKITPRKMSKVNRTTITYPRNSKFESFCSLLLLKFHC